MPGQFPDFLRECIQAGIERISSRLSLTAPFLRCQVDVWWRELCSGGPPASYFLEHLRFPVIQLPWWLARRTSSEGDTEFHRDVVYSSMNGYYFIRMIDNVMDGHGKGEINLLPALAFFHHEFAGVYMRYFGPEHEFWSFFSTSWYQTNEAAMRGAFTTNYSAQDFCRISAAKIAAVQIPVCATAYRAGRTDLIPAWLGLCERLARYFQTMDDLFDWNRDLQTRQGSYFLSEAERRRKEDETLHGWVLREGFSWGTDILHHQIQELRQTAGELQSPDVDGHLAFYEEQLTSSHQEIARGLSALMQTAAAFGSGPRGLSDIRHG